MSNAELLRDDGQSALISIETGTRGASFRIKGFLSGLFHARDLTKNVEIVTGFEFSHGV